MNDREVKASTPGSGDHCLQELKDSRMFGAAVHARDQHEHAILCLKGHALPHQFAKLLGL